MIRAVSRYTLEINKTGSPYFERAICFVKPEYAQSDRLDLHRAAQQLIAAFDAGVEEQTACGDVFAAQPSSETARASSGSADTSGSSIRQRVIKLLPLALSAAVGAGVTLLVMLLV